jgi:uncharacterized glyoxalase superfamily protein PhnB
MAMLTMTPMLCTWDMEGSVRFYTEVLGFTCERRVEGWASLKRDGVEMMLSAPNEHEGHTRPAFSGSLYFRVDDVDALWQAWRDRARVCYPIETFDYGMREFALYDNNGYVLQFGQALSAQ